MAENAIYILKICQWKSKNFGWFYPQLLTSKSPVKCPWVPFPRVLGKHRHKNRKSKEAESSCHSCNSLLYTLVNTEGICGLVFHHCVKIPSENNLKGGMIYFWHMISEPTFQVIDALFFLCLG